MDFYIFHCSKQDLSKAWTGHFALAFVNLPKAWHTMIIIARERAKTRISEKFLQDFFNLPSDIDGELIVPKYKFHA